MMYYIESPATNPHFNLALEQFVFDRLDKRHNYFMLWRNDNAIIVGKHQNTVAEINAPYVKEHNIRVVRRLSGGGAVYHDLGNVNFTFIVSAGEQRPFDFASFCRPVIRALASLGVTAELNGRNDMTIKDAKFSGNAQYRKRDRVMHHGTILYDSNLSFVGKALVVPKDKIESKGLQSVQSRVTNVKPHMQTDIPVEHFMAALKEAMFREYDMLPYTLQKKEFEETAALQKDVYDTWEWNYGASPSYTIYKERRVAGCGKLEVYMDIPKGGVIADIAFYGDYFGNGDARKLAGAIIGQKLERNALRASIGPTAVGECFHNMDTETFLDIIME